MPSKFGQFVKKALKKQGLSQRLFAQAVGLSQGGLNKILNDSHSSPPPPTGAQLSLWAGVLNLVDGDRQQFLDFAALAHLPREVRPKFEAWYLDHGKLKLDYRDLLLAYEDLDQRFRASKRVAEQ